jgi:hypothetical protein
MELQITIKLDEEQMKILTEAIKRSTRRRK